MARVCRRTSQLHNKGGIENPKSTEQRSATRQVGAMKSSSNMSRCSLFKASANLPNLDSKCPHLADAKLVAEICHSVDAHVFEL